MTQGFDKKFLIGTLYEIEKDIQALEAWSEWNANIMQTQIAEFKHIYSELNRQLQEVSEKLKE